MANKALPTCDVQACEEDASHILAFPKDSPLHQGQEPSPRCPAHMRQAVQSLPLGTYTLKPLKGGAADD